MPVAVDEVVGHEVLAPYAAHVRQGQRRIAQRLIQRRPPKADDQEAAAKRRPCCVFAEHLPYALRGRGRRVIEVHASDRLARRGKRPAAAFQRRPVGSAPAQRMVEGAGVPRAGQTADQVLGLGIGNFPQLCCVPEVAYLARVLAQREAGARERTFVPKRARVADRHRMRLQALVET